MSFDRVFGGEDTEEMVGNFGATAAILD